MSKVNFRTKDAEISVECSSTSTPSPEKVKRRNDREVKKRLKMDAIFKLYDKDNDGFILLSELKSLLQDGVNTSDFSEQLAKEILSRADTDNDEKLDFEEFYKLSQENDSIINKVTYFVDRYCRYLIPSQYVPSEAMTEIPDDKKQSMIGRAPTVYKGIYEKNIQFCPPPLTMIIFSLIEILIYICDLFDNCAKKDAYPTQKRLGSILAYMPETEPQYYRLMSYMFIHSGFWHLTMNVICQLALGIALELYHGWWRVTLIYLGGVLAGSLGHSLCDPSVSLVGASAGVFALVAAHIATVILNIKEMKYPLYQLVIFSLYITIDLGQTVYKKHQDSSNSIGLWAHLFGAIAGILIGVVVLKNFKVENWEKKLQWISIVIFVVFTLIGITIHLSLPNIFNPANECNLKYSLQLHKKNGSIKDFRYENCQFQAQYPNYSEFEVMHTCETLIQFIVDNSDEIIPRI